MTTQQYTWILKNNETKIPNACVAFNIFQNESPDKDYIIDSIDYYSTGLTYLDIYTAILSYHKLHFPDRPEVFVETISRLKIPTLLYKHTLEVIVFAPRPILDFMYIVDDYETRNLAINFTSNDIACIQNNDIDHELAKYNLTLEAQFPELYKQLHSKSEEAHD